MIKDSMLTLLLGLVLVCPAVAGDSLPTLKREALSNELMWTLETELMGHRESNGAVLECLAESIQSLLLEAGMEPTVESLVRVLTTPCEADTPGAGIKELLMPRAQSISVSKDASFAVIATPVYGGKKSLQIFRDTAHGISVHHMKR